MSNAYFKNFEEDRDLRDHLIGLLHVDSSLDEESIANLLSTSEISRVVNVGPAEISRSLSRLRKKGLIREVRRESRRFDEAAELSRVFPVETRLLRTFEDTKLTQAYVTHTITSTEAAAAHAMTIDICSFYAARLLRNYLLQFYEERIRLGVSWGFAVSSTLTHFKRLLDSNKIVTDEKHPTWDILNVVGDTHPSMAVHELRASDRRPSEEERRTMAAEYALGTMGSSALVMARELGVSLRSPHHPFAAPGWVKVDSMDSAQSRAALENMLRSFPIYSDVFEPGGELDVSQADVVLTGIGGRSILHEQLTKTRRLAADETLPAELVGDCSGVILSRDKGPVGLEGTDHASKLARTMIGIRANQLQTITAEAAEASRDISDDKLPRKLGVIMIAVGSKGEQEAKEKSEAVRVAIESGLVNILVIESAIAKYLVPN